VVISLVSLEVGKTHLRVDVTDHDADITLKIAQASAIVMRFYKKDVVPDDWIVNNSPISYDIPADIQAAVLLVLSDLYENREASIANPLSDAVKSLIPRDPTLA
jgi:hypothetical protein